MSELWWELPGVRCFIERVADDVRDGKNVVLCLPAHLPSGLAAAIQRTLGDGWSWDVLDLASDLPADPVGVVVTQFLPGANPSALWNTGFLVQADDFAGRLVWVDGMSPAAWPRWQAFLSQYADLVRSRRRDHRSLFLIPLVGELAVVPPREDVCLAVRSWRGVVGWLDMLLYTTQVIPASRLPKLQRQLAITVITELAQWDPVVGEYLGQEPLDRILDPRLVLWGIVKERGWLDVEPSRSRWELGMRDTFDDAERVHSAVLVLGDPDGEIKRRIWKAQVSVLLPFVEEQRRQLLGELRHCLQLPFTAHYGNRTREISSPLDLEIGHIEWQISQNHSHVSPETVQLVRRLKAIRDCLAHLDIVDVELFRS